MFRTMETMNHRECVPCIPILRSLTLLTGHSCDTALVGDWIKIVREIMAKPKRGLNPKGGLNSDRSYIPKQRAERCNAKVVLANYSPLKRAFSPINTVACMS